MADTDALIDTLSAAAGPIRRPLSPNRRALIWVALALPAGYLATMPLRKPGFDWVQSGAIWAELGILLSFAIGLGAIMAAFTTSIAGRAVRVRGWFAGAVAVWAAVNVAEIASTPHPLGRLGMGGYCFAFMLLASLPMILLVVAAIRQTRALHPQRVLLLAGVGIAFIATALLGLCHPPIGKVVDFAAHIVAAAAILGLTLLGGRRWIAL